MEAAEMRWFGFGFNAFGQISSQDEEVKGGRSDAVEYIKVSQPVELRCHARGCSRHIQNMRASWSRRAAVHVTGGSCVCVAGFSSADCRVAESGGCRDASISESHLVLLFPHKIESWDLQKEKKEGMKEEKKEEEESPSWSMDIASLSESSHDGTLPLVPGGYVTPKPPFFHTLSPRLKAKSLSLGREHAVLLTATGAAYTWGLGSHGQLGHGVLTSEEEPRAVEALWGMNMSSAAAGGWHSVCISDGGDLYVWGWNESGQLGLPSRGLRKQSQQSNSRQEADPDPAEEGENQEEVFISIQAFPALVDVTPPCEIRTVSCGSRHTAAVTTKGDLYTWGWGEYGQLGHRTLTSSDEPRRVEFPTAERMHVVDVVCGTWNTFAAVVKEEGALK